MCTPGFPVKRLVRPLILCAVWGTSFAVILAFSPVQPRMTLQAGPDISIIGITPDSRELVALTRRRNPKNGFEFSSGPVQIWNLQTGQKRVLCLPEQPCTGPMDHSQEPPLMVDEQNRMAEPLDIPFRGRWLQLEFESTLFRHSHDSLRANLIFHLDSGDYHLSTERKEYVCGLELSPTSRWCVETQMPETLWKDGFPCRIRVIETETEKELIAFETPRYFTESAFSPDDRFFAHSTRDVSDGDGDEPGRLRVWQIDPPQLLYEITGCESAAAFSPDGELLAAVVTDDKRTKVVVRDAGSGLPVMEHVVHHKPLPAAYDNELRFSPDGHWLFYSRDSLLDRVAGQYAGHASMVINCGIDLRTNQRVDLSAVDFDVRVSATGHASETLPPLAMDAERHLIELPTGRRLDEIPNELEPMVVTQDGRTMVAEHVQLEESALMKILLTLSDWNLPIPKTLWTWAGNTSEWYIMDVASRQVRYRLPAQDWVHWFSPDEQTLVTKPTDGSPVVHIWDFPPRKPWRAAALWALLAPALVSLWMWMRSRSRANSRGDICWWRSQTDGPTAISKPVCVRITSCTRW